MLYLYFGAQACPIHAKFQSLRSTRQRCPTYLETPQSAGALVPVLEAMIFLWVQCRVWLISACKRRMHYLCLPFQCGEGHLGTFALPSMGLHRYIQCFFVRAQLSSTVPGAQSQAKCQGRSRESCRGRQLSIMPAKSAVLAQRCQGGET